MPNDVATPPVEPHLDPRSFLRGTPPFDLLTAERGIPSEKFDRVYAPIGLAIGARSPAEIAVCHSIVGAPRELFAG